MSAPGGLAVPAPASAGRAGRPGGDPLEVLFEVEGLPAYDLPEQLQAGYGGPLGCAEPRLVANFVATVDGVVALPDLPRSTRPISGGSSADRFLLGLLRTCADVVLIGAGTLHAHPGTIWTGQHAHPPARDAFAELRYRRSQAADPQLAVLTTSGNLDVDHPALRRGALVLTTERGATQLTRRGLPAACEVLAVDGDDTVDLPAALGALHARGHRLLVSEAGPHLFGSLLAGDLVDELFLTQSPLLAGRADGRRLGLVEGTPCCRPCTATPDCSASAAPATICSCATSCAPPDPPRP